MAKIDAQRRADVTPPIMSGELVPVASVVQITNLTVSGPYNGDFQIVNSGRLIVGEYVDIGPRVIISQDGLRGWNSNNVNTFSVWTRTVTEPSGTSHAPGDMHLGNLSANFLRYDQTTGTLGLYTPQGAGFIARRDGTLQAGHADGAHMLWNAEAGALQIRRGDDVKAQIDANGDAMFDGTIYASGGRIYGLMVVDDILRAGDVDGPAVYLGKFVREDATGGLIETSEIVATNEQNLPWFRVVAGGETLPGYFHLGGTGQYDQQLSYDGQTLALDGTVYARAGSFEGTVSVGPNGAFTWANGKGVADAQGIRHTETLTTFWRVQPTANEVMRVEANSATSGAGVGILAYGSADGVSSVADSGRGVYGKAGTGAGIQGRADGSGGIGVQAEAIDLATVALTATGVTKLGDGGSTNYSQFDSSGHLTFAGTAKPWTDMLIEPVARTTGNNAPVFEKWFDDTAGTSRGVYLYSFDDATTANEKEVFFNLQMSHAWDGGDIQFHVHWVPAVDQTAPGEDEIAPRWGLEYAWKEPGGVFGDTTIVYATVKTPADLDVVAGTHYITAFTALSPGSTADDLSSVLIGRLFRNSGNAADTYNTSGAKCGLLYIDAHYQLTRIGSTDEYYA